MSNFYTLMSLVGRNIKLFLRDKMAVFFSILAPLIVLMLYILFLENLQLETMKQFFLALVESGDIALESVPTNHAIKAVIDSWMMGGVLAITCLTVSLSANSVMVRDKSSGVLTDSLASPLKKHLMAGSYYLFNYLVTVCITSFVFIVCLIYKSFGGLNMTFIEVLFTYAILLLSVLSATLLTVFIANFIKSSAVLDSIVGIFSAAVGFLIGAYMPINTLPTAVQYTVGFFPGTHSAGLLKTFMMDGALNNLLLNMPVDTLDILKDIYGVNVLVVGTSVSSTWMLVYLLSSIIFFSYINIIFFVVKNRDSRKKSRKKRYK